MSQQIEILERETAFDGFFRIERFRLRHGLFAGGLSGTVTRELFERGNSAAVLLYDADRDEVVLTEQFRIGALNAPGGAWLMEIVAGIVEPGERGEDVVRREAQEEADALVNDLIPICEYIASPGGSSERVALFCGKVDTSGMGGIHGLDEEDEDIKVHVVPFDEAFAMIETGTVNSAMPIMALQWLALNREWVRDRWAS